MNKQTRINFRTQKSTKQQQQQQKIKGKSINRIIFNILTGSTITGGADENVQNINIAP